MKSLAPVVVALIGGVMILQGVEGAGIIVALAGLFLFGYAILSSEKDKD